MIFRDRFPKKLAFCLDICYDERGVVWMEKKYHINYCFLDEPVYYGDTMLVQLGRLYCMPDTIIEKHAHMNWYELTIVTDGAGVVSTNDVPTAVSKGDIYLSYPGDFHEIASSADAPLKYDFFSFNTKNPLVKKELKQIVKTMYHANQRVFRDSQIATAVSDAILEFSAEQCYRREILGALFGEILFYILRDFAKEPPAVQKKHTISAEELCFQVMHYIDTHIYSMENLSVLGEKFCYNYSYLSSVFQKTTGITLAEYYRTRRLDAARLLLNEDRLKIHQIAEMLKYSSAYAFSKAFKNQYGIAPKHELQKIKLKNTP